jgi:hypothetical protein
MQSRRLCGNASVTFEQRRHSAKSVAMIEEYDLRANVTEIMKRDHQRTIQGFDQLQDFGREAHDVVHMNTL